MASAFEVREWVDREPCDVWARLTNWSRAADWMAGVERLSAAGPTEVGTRIEFHARGKSRASEITHLVEGREVTLTSQQGPVSASYRYRCEPENGGTRVSLSADCQISGMLRVLGPLLRFAMRRTDGGQLGALKRVLERP